MRLRSFGMIGVVAAVAVACGSAGSGSIGSVGVSGTPTGGTQPPLSGIAPPSGTTPPTNPNQPPNSTSTPAGGTLCDTACALLAKYPCSQSSTCGADAGADAGVCITPSNCLSQCKTSLASATADELACTKASLALLQCVDAHGDASCPADGNQLKISDAAAQDCGQQLSAMQTACGTSVQNGGGTCTLSGDGCQGCPDNCSKCMCASNNNASSCAAMCPDAG